MTVRIRALGTFGVDDPVVGAAIGKGRCREALGVLVASRHRALPTAALVAALWDDEPPPTAATMVHGWIRRLRGALGERTIVHDGDGYRLALDPTRVDLWEAEDAAAAGDHRRARVLWAEPVFGPYTERPWARDAVADLSRLADLVGSGPDATGVLAGRPVGRLIGRNRERATLQRALDRERLVTVVGLGGVGKTTLARHVAADRLPVFVADLATGVGSVMGRIADDLGLVATGDDRWDRQAVGSLLRGRGATLVLDGCEHDVDGARHATEWLLEACPDLSILATSRVALGAPGEHVVALLPFADPANRHGDAVALLIERAAELGVELGGADRERLAAICATTGGVPLAIELAVTEAVFGPLGSSGAHRGPGPDPPVAASPAHAVTEAVQHALERLTRSTAVALHRLARFDHGFPPRLLAGVVDEGVSPPAVLHELHGTRLLSVRPRGRLALTDPVRVVLLATDRGGDPLGVAADALGAVVQAVRPDLARPIVSAALDPAVEELPNLLVMLRRLGDAGRAPEALRLATAAGEVWAEAGHWARGAGELSTVLATVTPAGVDDEDGARRCGEAVPVDPLVWAHAVRALGITAATYAALREHHALMARAAAVASDHRAGPLEAHLVFQMTLGAGYGGDMAAATAHLERLHRLAAQLDNEYLRVMIGHLDGLAALVAGDVARAATHCGQTADRLVAMSALADAARVLRTAGLAWAAVDAFDDATAAFKAAEALAVESGSQGTLATIRSDIVELRHRRGDLDRSAVERALESVVAVGNLRAAGVLQMRLGVIDRDPAVLANAVLDLLVTDPARAAVGLAELVAVLPSRHPVQAVAPELAARLREEWGSPLSVTEAAQVDRLCDARDTTSVGTSPQTVDDLRSMLRTLAVRGSALDQPL